MCNAAYGVRVLVLIVVLTTLIIATFLSINDRRALEVSFNGVSSSLSLHSSQQNVKTTRRWHAHPCVYSIIQAMIIFSFSSYRRVIVVGDSFATFFMDALRQEVKRRGCKNLNVRKAITMNVSY